MFNLNFTLPNINTSTLYLIITIIIINIIIHICSNLSWDWSITISYLSYRLKTNTKMWFVWHFVIAVKCAQNKRIYIDNNVILYCSLCKFLRNAFLFIHIYFMNWTRNFQILVAACAPALTILLLNENLISRAYFKLSYIVLPHMKMCGI